MGSWMDGVLAALAALGIKMAVLVSSAVGGFLSLKFFDGERQADGTFKPITTAQKWGIAVSGTALGVYVPALLIELFALTDKTGRVEIGLGIIVALFGMSLAAAVIKAVREMNLGAVAESWLKRR